MTAESATQRFAWHPEMHAWEWRFHLDTPHPKRRFISSAMKEALEWDDNPQMDLCFKSPARTP